MSAITDQLIKKENMFDILKRATHENLLNFRITLDFTNSIEDLIIHN